jgi:hypothetical protein
MAYKDVYKMSDEQIMGMIFDQLYAAPEIRRKDLIERCVAQLGFTQSQLGDKGTNAPVIRAKSRIGMVLSACIKSGYIVESEVGRLLLIGTGKHIISREKGRDYVIALLEREGCLSKQRIFQQAERDFGTDRTPDKKDDNDLRAVLGKVLLRLEDEKHIVKTRSGYRLSLETGYPNTEMGSCLREAAYGGDLKECFLRAIHIKGGEWFEVYCVNLLDSYYRNSGKILVDATVTGGSDDGGIDGVIRTEDWLGYRETVLMQMKNRNSIISSKDVREFYGAVCAEHGSRGVFITISQFHREAQKLLDKVDNLIGIDGDKLFKIACQCEIGIISKDGEPALDEKMFLDT